MLAAKHSTRVRMTSEGMPSDQAAATVKEPAADPEKTRREGTQETLDIPAPKPAGRTRKPKTTEEGK